MQRNVVECAKQSMTDMFKCFPSRGNRTVTGRYLLILDLYHFPFIAPSACGVTYGSNDEDGVHELTINSAISFKVSRGFKIPLCIHRGRVYSSTPRAPSYPRNKKADRKKVLFVMNKARFTMYLLLQCRDRFKTRAYCNWWKWWLRRPLLLQRCQELPDRTRQRQTPSTWTSLRFGIDCPVGSHVRGRHKRNGTVSWESFPNSLSHAVCIRSLTLIAHGCIFTEGILWHDIRKKWLDSHRPILQQRR